jgi:hypothetical protein
MTLFILALACGSVIDEHLEVSDPDAGIDASEGGTDADIDADTDTDTDVDTDTDTDSDSDTDTDSDSDTDTETSTEPSCGGWVSPELGGCWYVGDLPVWTGAAWDGQSCNEVCATHGGFDTAVSAHNGTEIGEHFYPEYDVWSNLEVIEIVVVGGGVTAIRGATGAIPDGDYAPEGSSGKPVCSCFE